MRKQTMIAAAAFFMLLLFNQPSAKAQLFDPHDAIHRYDQVFKGAEVDISPAFPGGNSAMINYLNEHLTYPFHARELAVEGDVRIEFVVTADGAITNAQILQHLGYGCDEEVIKVIEEMPKWTPGLKDNVKVATRVTLAVSFRLII